MKGSSCRHCLVWTAQSGFLVICCVHCLYRQQPIRFADPAKLDQMVAESQSGHRRLCYKGGVTAPGR